MKTILSTAMVATALCLSASTAAAAAQLSEPRTIDARVAKVALGGVINLNVKQGATASLVLVGEKRELANVLVTQVGDTLTIDTDSRGWHLGKVEQHQVRAELTLPSLNELSSRGVGATDIKGFSGNEVRLSLDGAGSVNLNSNYKNVVARLEGVGSMTLNPGNADQVDLKLRGAGHIEINGNATVLRAQLGGVGSLDAHKLQADAVELDMSGLGGATVYAKTSAKLRLSGLGSATVYGNPATRQARAHGLGSVSWQ